MVQIEKICLYWIVHLLRKAGYSILHSVWAAGTVQTRYRVPDKGQTNEEAGFLVSRSLTLPPLHPERDYWGGTIG